LLLLRQPSWQVARAFGDSAKQTNTNEMRRNAPKSGRFIQFFDGRVVVFIKRNHTKSRLGLARQKNRNSLSDFGSAKLQVLAIARRGSLSPSRWIMKPRIISVIVGAILSPSLSVASQSVAYATGNAPYRAGLISWEAPAYPFLAKLHHCQGRGVFRVTINTASGHPAQVVVLNSTGFGILDDSVLAALRAWRWKPGTRGPFDIPITFTLSKDPNPGKPPAGSSRLPKSPR